MAAAAAALYDVELAEGASGVDVEPLIYAGAVEMVAARKLTQLHPVIVCTEADATLRILC